MKRRPQANHAIMNKTLAQTNDFNTSAQDNSEVVDLTSD